MNAKEFDWSDCPAVWRDPGRMGGQWCFAQTRLPIAYLFEHLADGGSLDDFVDWYAPLDPALCHEVLLFAASHSRHLTVAA